MLPFFPLASGLLTGKYRRGDAAARELAAVARAASPASSTDARWDTIEKLEAYAPSAASSLLEVAIGGLAAQPTVASVIAGATTADQVRANVAAGAWTPGEADLAALKAL